MDLGTQQYQQLPGYLASLGNVGNNIQSETAGVLPDDVKRAIAQAAAENGIATGTQGSANSNAALLRALGLTSLNLTNMGQTNLHNATAALPGLSQNPNFYVGSQQAGQTADTNAILASAPQPKAAAAAGMAAAAGGRGGTVDLSGIGAHLGGASMAPKPYMSTGSAFTTGGYTSPRTSTPNYNLNSIGGNAIGDVLDKILQQYDPESGLNYSPSSDLGSFDFNSGEGFYGGGTDNFDNQFYDAFA